MYPEMINTSCLIVKATSPDSSSLTWAMHTVGWLELGQTDKAAASFQKQLAYIKNEFQVGFKFLRARLDGKRLVS
jgi:hypothetical protein